MAKKVTTVLLLISAPCVFAYTATEGAQVLSVAPTKAKAVAVSIYQQKEMLEHELRKLQDDHATGSKDLAADLAATQARLAAVTAKCLQCKTAEDELGVAYTAAIAAHRATEDILAQLNSLAGLSSAVTAAEALVDKSPLLSAIASYKTLVDAFSAASATQLVGPPDFAAMVTTINAQWDAVKAARDAKTTAEQASTATSPCTDAATGAKVLCTDADRTAAATAETTADNAVTDKKAAQVTACAGMPEGTSAAEPEPTQAMFQSVGLGVCRDDDGKYTPWGWMSGTHPIEYVEAACAQQSSCVAFQLHHSGDYQVLCTKKEGICTSKGNGATDITQGIPSEQHNLPCMKKMP